MNYKNMLLAVNISDETNVVVESAIKFAKKTNVSHIDLVTVIDCVSPFVPALVDYQHSLENQAKEKLSSIAKLITGIDVRELVLIGNPATELVAFAEEAESDLIVTGSHGKHGVNLVLGSVANSILHKAKCDVLTVRVGEEKLSKVGDYSRFIFPTDLESDSSIVAETAKSLASSYDAKIDTIFVIPNDSVSLMSYDSEKVKTALDEFVDKNSLNGKAESAIGGVANCVVEKAKEFGDDLIVVGSHRRSALGRLFLGSTANSILHHADRDVLVVKLK